MELSMSARTIAPSRDCPVAALLSGSLWPLRRHIGLDRFHHLYTTKSDLR